jgi:two-component system, cell cycle sensor histidine kinase and response regulator CckA
VTAPVAIVLLGGVASLAIAVACVAILRVRAARAALRANEAKTREHVERGSRTDESDRLVGDIVHDLNDLLTAITGHTELLIASLDPSGTTIQDADEIRRAALSAAGLTRPLRILSGGHHASADVVDVNALTARAAKALQQMLGPNIEVTLALDKDVKRVRISRCHLEEIVLNLGIQARGAMPHGGTLTVAMHMHDERDAAGGAPSEYVRMIVTDTGVGMSADAQSKLFEPFFASEDGGVGAIGLAKVDAIVKQAGGRIQVASAVGVGTTFTIDLPATSEPAAGPEPAFAETRLTAPVLVVEDEPNVRELVKLVLVRTGRDVVAVAGPHAALTALRRQPAISLTLVDVVMPEMNGYDLVAEARTISPGVRVVFMSGFARDTARHPASDGFLVKPFTVESLTSIVEEALA